MSYNKAMKHSNNHRKDKYYQPVLGMPFEGLKEGEHIESYQSIAERTAESYHVKAFNEINNTWERMSKDFLTESEAIDESFIFDEKGYRTRIYSDKDMRVAGW
jgi:hypothetical protein